MIGDKGKTICSIIILVVLLYMIFIYIPDHNVVYDRTGVITDKWTELNLGTTKYILEVNNTWTEYVDDDLWHNIEIGDMYNFTEVIWEE